MPKVNNWQIGREMDYPYEPHSPKRQVAYIFDTNKCIACQTCTIACKTAWTSGKGQEQVFYNNVETKPYGGYPLRWDEALMEKRGAARWKDGVLASETIFEGNGVNQPPDGHRPQVDDYKYPNMGEDDVSAIVEEAVYHANGDHPMWMFYLARICNHCSNPACLAACPRKAIYKRDEDGIVLVDQERCRGYQECVKACPYKKVFYNAVSRVSEKCIGCFPRVEDGLQALCVEACIGKIRLHGFIAPPDREPDPDNPIDYIVRIRELALPIYPQYGTAPNVYYIPPIHVNIGFCEQMFGGKAEHSRQLYRNLIEDDRLLGALMLFGATDKIIHTFDIKNEIAYGYDEQGDEICQVPYREPVYERPHKDERHGVYRHNTT